MAVFEYYAVVKNREEFTESGTVVAKNEDDAKKKLQGLNFDRIRVKRINGIAAFFRMLTADVK